MIDWLKRLIARQELDELNRWRMHWWEARQFLGENKDVREALDYLRCSAKGYEKTPFIRDVRDRMRERQKIHQEIRNAALEEAAEVAFNAPITAEMMDSDAAKAAAFPRLIQDQGAQIHSEPSKPMLLALFQAGRQLLGGQDVCLPQVRQQAVPQGIRPHAELHRQQ